MGDWPSSMGFGWLEVIWTQRAQLQRGGGLAIGQLGISARVHSSEAQCFLPEHQERAPAEQDVDGGQGAGFQGNEEHLQLSRPPTDLHGLSQSKFKPPTGQPRVRAPQNSLPRTPRAGGFHPGRL